MSYTREEIQLEAVPLDAPLNTARRFGERVVWRWKCPGPGPHTGDVYATENEPRELLAEGAILRDPICVSCRKRGVFPRQGELPL